MVIFAASLSAMTYVYLALVLGFIPAWLYLVHRNEFAGVVLVVLGVLFVGAVWDASHRPNSWLFAGYLLVLLVVVGLAWRKAVRMWRDRASREADLGETDSR
jgi:apolipoprotein N-acyltransferase